ncbi:MAG: hypothetical protein WBV96_21480 [Polyangia bacterium]
MPLPGKKGIDPRGGIANLVRKGPHFKACGCEWFVDLVVSQYAQLFNVCRELVRHVVDDD